MAIASRTAVSMLLPLISSKLIMFPSYKEAQIFMYHLFVQVRFHKFWALCYSRPSSENYQVQLESSNSAAAPFNSISNIADQLTQISKGFKEEQYYGQQPNYVQQKPRLRIQAPVKRSIYFNVPQGMQNNMPEQIMNRGEIGLGTKIKKIRFRKKMAI